VGKQYIKIECDHGGQRYRNYIGDIADVVGMCGHYHCGKCGRTYKVEVAISGEVNKIELQKGERIDYVSTATKVIYEHAAK